MDSIVLPEDYLKYVMTLKSDISYIISTSYEETPAQLELVPTITELGLCYTYNGEIAPYNSYKLVTRNKHELTNSHVFIENNLFQLLD